MGESFPVRLKVAFIILSLLISSSLYSIELGDFSDIFTRAPNTINAYRSLCGTKTQLSSNPLSESQWKNICEVVKESELCEDIPEEDKITCEDQSEDQIDVASFGFFWNCIRGLGPVLMDMAEFIKEAIFTAVGYAFDSETRDEVNQQVADIHDALSLYIANEYAHLKEENPDASKGKVWAKLAGKVLGDALGFLSDLMKESMVGLGCYNQDARQKKACEYVFAVTVPPASFFALFKLGPSAIRLASRSLQKNRSIASKRISELNGPKGTKDIIDVDEDTDVISLVTKPDPYTTTDVDEIIKLQSHLKPTNPRKKTPIKGLDEDYWQNGEPVIVTKGEKSFPVTYSFDSEIPHSAVFNLVYSDPEATAKLTALLRGLKVREKGGTFGRSQTKPFTVDRSELRRILEKSDKQLNTFVLRRGVDPDKEVFDLTDINASYVDDFMVPILKKYNKDKEITDLVNKDFDLKSVDDFFKGYQKLADDIFTRENIPADATRDQMWIEMVHKSFEDSPGEFRNLMLERYRPLTNSASSHLHVGVPGIVPKDKMIAITRAVETRIILENARATARPGKLYATSYTSLKKGADSSRRSAGVVRMNINRFKEPTEYHDLEIRQYNKMEEGMNNISLAGDMARNHDRIRMIDMPGLKKIDDPSTSNLTGALTYAANALKSSPDQEMRRKAARLNGVVDEILEEGTITPEHRVLVQEVLKEEKILELLDSGVFLEGPK